jgi:serine phosphatase RsbU (regulator of sigma subunit)
MTYALVDLRARTMTYARAGHTPLIYLSNGGVRRQLHVLAPEGLVVGLKLDGGETFERLLREETMAIHEGDVLMLFTDGITEAMNASDDCFGEARLGQLLEQHAQLSGEELRERVLREISTFVGDVPQHDDMTLLLLRIGGAAAAAPSRVEAVAGARS